MTGKIYRNLGYAVLLSSFVIAVLNVVLTYGLAKGHEIDAIRYTIYIIMASFPIVIVGGALSKVVSKKKGLEYFIIPKKRTEREILRIKKNEIIVVDSSPHMMYFLKLGVALGLMTLLFLFISSAYRNVPLEESGWWWQTLIISGVLVILSYVLSTDMLPHHSYVLSFAHAWSMVYAFWWGITAAGVMKVQVEMSYPRAFWERFLGLPSLAMIMFSIILFLFSGMLWRIDSYLSKKEPGPLGTISITLLAAGIAALFPPMWFLFSKSVREIFFMATIGLTLIYWLLLSLFLYYRGGMKFVFTNIRIITVKDFLGREIHEHPYDSITSVDILQSPLGEYFDFGDLRFRVKRGKEMVRFTVHGIKNPVLVKNMVMALASREKKRKTMYKKNAVKKRVRKKPPVKTYHIEPY